MPAPSISTAAVGTAPVKSSFGWPVLAAALVIVTRMVCRPPVDQGNDSNKRLGQIRLPGWDHIAGQSHTWGVQLPRSAPPARPGRVLVRREGDRRSFRRGTTAAAPSA
jgi:hypothetical protein